MRQVEEYIGTVPVEPYIQLNAKEMEVSVSKASKPIEGVQTHHGRRE